MSISITLFNSGVYNPGSVLEGKVVCILNTRKQIRGIILKIRGREHTSWEERESYYDSQAKETRWRTVHYTGDNKFLAIQETLHGEGFINLGRHEFPFRFVLPKNIPSTYNGAHGHIRYYVKANVDIPMGFDYEDERKFIVMAPINFNDMLRNIELNPTQYQDETNLCCCCCASDPITFDVYLQKEAFVVGEVIPIKIHILNMSNVTIESLSVHLKRRIIEKCTSPRTNAKEETEIVASDGSTGVGAHGDRDYTIELRVPSGFELPNFANCQLFSQDFELKIEAEIPGCHSNMKMEIPLQIGHIPVDTQIAVNTIANPLAQFPTAPQPYPPGDAAPPYPTSPFSVPPNNAAPIGFAVPNLPPPFPGIPDKNLPGVHGMPPPYPPGDPSLAGGSSAPYPVANAPRDETAPSAPSKAELANDDFIVLDGDDGGADKEPPPPSYHEAMRK